MRRAGLASCVLWFSLGAAQNVVEEGKRAFDAGNYTEAVRLFEKAQQSSARCEIFFYLGLARYRLKQLDRAIINFRSAAECDPKLPEPHIALGEAYTQKGDDNRALAAFESALKAQPNHAGALRSAAALYIRHQMNEQAVGVLERLSRMEPGDVQVRSNLGAAYAATSQLEKAEIEFQAAIQRNPVYPSALTGIGNVYLKTGRAEQATEVLQKAAKIAPGAYEPRFLLGAAYNHLERYGEAVRELEAALSQGGGDPEIYYNMARAYRALGREEERKGALAQFTKLKARSERDKEWQREAGRLVERAKTLVHAGDLAGAIALLERARELHRGDAQILFRLAGLYYDVQQYAMARRLIQEAMAVAPAEWAYHYLLGLIEKSTGNLQAARSSLEAAVLLNSAAADAYNQLGDLAMRQNDAARAIEDFRRAVQLDPQQPAYRLNLEAAQRALKP